MEGKGLNY